ncbi:MULTISPECIES: DEAD/DEAH box helicase [unclassified Ruegeria]|uniref:helicase-related protein n=1 Tax=unclassified Ruegeria TaxID=2625375 RepID=UPI001A108E37|nr:MULTISPECIES: DEAD/DEAH box helicase [unclassified Ruegeria]NOD33767.1 disulfide oxidoreductase [Ruegeria sp. HKCCD7296]NOE40558.1 disulfide oxidoreductase [Ruegeria sp. HKCCD7319]
MVSGSSRVVAVLGPTNTGKTHYAIERMLGYRTGVIGLPLRLLAREVYDKIVAIRGPSVVALVTGEERIVPPRTQYWVCTVEAMPEGMGADFVAIDEIQLCADPERGHVFTDRLLRSRGTNETLFLGSDTMRGPIAALVPEVQFVRRERMSQLVYSGSKKISRMPARSAIVGFSVDNVYAIAELLRRQKGGAAVVMGALSPRTRNAQVDLYQNGEVDYLVATDAIGMGLNLDVNHVAFSSLTKFDGRRMRPLAPNELAQIAGRAGRGMSDGTFGVTGEAPPLDEGVAQAIMDSRFTPMKKLNWRNAALRFGSIDALITSLEVSPNDEHLIKARPADDLNALKSLSQVTEVVARASDPQSIRLLWDVCRIPDFRGISHAEHASLLEVIYGHLHERGSIPNDFMARQIRRIDQTQGDIDTLSKRLAYIRTWTYVAQRNGWVRDESHWRDETRTVEDRLSDALHDRLTQRFVDRRTSVLLRRLKQKEALLAEVNDKGEVTVEGEFVGRLEGFRFTPDKSAQGTEAKALKSASLQALAPQFHLRADRFYNAPDTEIDFTDQGGLMWGEYAVGKLVAGAEPLKPMVEVFVDEAAGPDVEQKVQRRLQHFIDRKVAALFEPLLNLSRDEELSGLAKGFAFRMVEALGVLPRGQVAQEVKDLDQDARGALRKHGIRFGQFTIFMPLLLKPAPTRLRLVLWALSSGLQEFPEAPPPGLVTVPVAKDAPQGYDTMCGYRDAGERSIRIDMLERLADMLRAEDSRGGFEAKPDMLSITGMTLEQFADLMQGLGYKAERGEREKVKAVASEQPAAEAVEQPVAEDSAAPEATSEEAAAPAEASAEATTSTEAAAEAPAPDAAPDEPEVEVFYTFTWGRQRQQNRGPRREQGQGKGKPRGKPQDGRGKPHGKKGGKPQGAKTFSSRPPKKEKAIDPDNPFAAALMGLKDGN